MALAEISKWRWAIGVTGEIGRDKKAGFPGDAVRSQVIDAMEAQEIKEIGHKEA